MVSKEVYRDCSGRPRSGPRIADSGISDGVAAVMPRGIRAADEKTTQESLTGVKAKVALAGDKRLVELAQQVGLHPHQITQWKQRLLGASADVFAR
jgi:hypothetical protein